MTEDEAKTKWCPFAHVREDVRSETVTNGGWPVLIGRVSSNRPGEPCLGAACMAWRWDFTPSQAEQYAKDAPRSHALKPFVGRGHCGLAGSRMTLHALLSSLSFEEIDRLFKRLPSEVIEAILKNTSNPPRAV